MVGTTTDAPAGSHVGVDEDITPLSQSAPWQHAKGAYSAAGQGAGGDPISPPLVNEPRATNGSLDSRMIPTDAAVPSSSGSTPQMAGESDPSDAGGIGGAGTASVFGTQPKGVVSGGGVVAHGVGRVVTSVSSTLEPSSAATHSPSADAGTAATLASATNGTLDAHVFDVAPSARPILAGVHYFGAPNGVAGGSATVSEHAASTLVEESPPVSGGNSDDDDASPTLSAAVQSEPRVARAGWNMHSSLSPTRPDAQASVSLQASVHTNPIVSAPVGQPRYSPQQAHREFVPPQVSFMRCPSARSRASLFGHARSLLVYKKHELLSA